MGHMSYNKVSRRSLSSCRGRRCFRLNPRKLSVYRLRAKFLYLFRLFSRWRSSCGHALESIKKGIARSSSSCSSSSRRNLVIPNIERSNSFYSEAIADCLEFIKRGSISDEYKSVNEM
ncbi:hypothetical protein ACSBR2_009437 [Camellia fascicularis]